MSLSRKIFNVCVCLFIALALAGAPMLSYASGGGGHGGEAKKEGGHGDAAKKEGSGDGGEQPTTVEEEITGGKFEGDPIYIHIKPIVLPVITERGAEQIVTMLVDIQTKDYKAATNLHANMPRLRDAILYGLYGGLSDGSMRQKHALDLDKIKKLIRDRINRVFGEGQAVDVLVQAIAQRKL